MYAALPVVAGATASLVVMIWVSRFEWVQITGTGEVARARVAWPWFTLIGTIVTIGSAWLTRFVLLKTHRE